MKGQYQVKYDSCFTGSLKKNQNNNNKKNQTQKKKNKPQTALNFVGLVGFAAPVMQHLNLKFPDFIL